MKQEKQTWYNKSGLSPMEVLVSKDLVVTLPSPPEIETRSKLSAALEKAKREANAFGTRLYAESPQRDLFPPLNDFEFTPESDAYTIRANKRVKQGSIAWVTMTIPEDAPATHVDVTGHTERIDPLAVMLSYLALRRGTPLSYQLPVLKQILSADEQGVLSLNG